MFVVAKTFMPYDPINAKPEMSASERKIKEAHDMYVNAQLEIQKREKELLEGKMTAEKIEQVLKE